MHTVVDSYNELRAKLVHLYKTLTRYTYLVNIRRSAFHTLEELERMEKYHPIGGLSRFNNVEEIPLTVARMLVAYRNVGDELSLGFRYPSKDIPVIYENIQQYIKSWTEVMLGLPGYLTPPMEELMELENLARMLFANYRYYKISERNREMTTAAHGIQDGLAAVYLSMLKYGREQDDDEYSFVSYIDLYYQATGEGMPQISQHLVSGSDYQVNPKATFELPTLHIGLE